MRNLSRVSLVLVLLLLVTSVATAKGPDLEPFSTTGYTLFYPLPEQELLPSGHIKFHLFTQGGGEDESDDLMCQAYSILLGTPISTCDELCNIVGQPCGTTGMFDGGSFSFEEWGVNYLTDPEDPTTTLGGANHGLMNIAMSEVDQAEFRFAGTSSPAEPPYYPLGTVQGSFEVLDGTGAYKKLEGEGIYFGNAGYVFTVDYTPCKKGNCQRCAVFGEGDLQLIDNTVKWTFTNEGNKKVKIQDVVVNWPEGNGENISVSVVDSAVYEGSGQTNSNNIPGYYSDIPADLLGKNKDVMIKKGASRTLTLDFQDDISSLPEDYTILVEFEQGCAVTFVAFPEE